MNRRLITYVCRVFDFNTCVERDVFVDRYTEEEAEVAFRQFVEQQNKPLTQAVKPFTL